MVFQGRVYAFRTVGQTAFALLRSLLGDFDFAQLQESHAYMGPFFFICFVAIAVFIVLNMCVYSSSSSSSSSSSVVVVLLRSARERSLGAPRGARSCRAVLCLSRIALSLSHPPPHRRTAAPLPATRLQVHRHHLQRLQRLLPALQGRARDAPAARDGALRARRAGAAAAVRALVQGRAQSRRRLFEGPSTDTRSLAQNADTARAHQAAKQRRCWRGRRGQMQRAGGAHAVRGGGSAGGAERQLCGAVGAAG